MNSEKIFKKLYSVFSSYAKPNRVIGSPITTNEGDDIRLLAKPLKSLTIEDFGTYPFKAITTWGTVEDFKYFLPRILELSYYSFSLVDDSIFFDKILYSDWQNWREDEKKVFEEYLLGMWNDASQLPEQNLQKIEILTKYLNYFIKDIEHLVRTWAKQWIEDENERLFETLVMYLNTNWIDIFYEYKPHHSFLKVIIESNLCERLEIAFYKYEKSKPKFAEQISDCEQKLSYYLSNY